jgi:RNA polymerase sigma factor (sigma-70 family)
MRGTTFHSLYQAHAKDVYRFARFLTGSDDAAADITSETFLRAWAGRYRIRVETAKGYLLAIARNLARDRGRLASRWPDGDVPEQSVAPNAEVRIELRRVLEAIRALPPEYREPLTLAAIGVGYDEIGRLLGISISTVKIRVHRARLKLTSTMAGSPGVAAHVKPRKSGPTSMRATAAWSPLRFLLLFPFLRLFGLSLAIGLPVNRNDLGVMCEPIDQGDRARGIRKDGVPLFEG